MASLLRGQGQSCLRIHAGDWAQGSLYEIVHGTRIAVDMVRALNYTLLTLGNHEFDFGLWWPVQFISSLAAGQHVVVSNLDWRDRPDNVTILPQWEHPDGICFVGVVLESTPNMVKPLYPTLEFKDPAASIRSAISRCGAEARERVVVISHLGFPSDRDLCDAVPEIDVIVGGHTHTLHEPSVMSTRADGSTCIVAQAQAHGLYLSRLAVVWDSSGVASVDAEGTSMLSVDSSVPEDPAIAAALEERYTPGVGKFYLEPAGVVSAPLTEKETMSELVCRAMFWETESHEPQPVLCFNNRGGVRSFLTDTDVSVGEVFDALPFDNTVATVLVPEALVYDILADSDPPNTFKFAFGRGGLRRCSNESFQVGRMLVRAGGEGLVPIVATDYVLTRSTRYDVQGRGQSFYAHGRKWNIVVVDYLGHLDRPFAASARQAAPSCSGGPGALAFISRAARAPGQTPISVYMWARLLLLHSPN